MGVRVRGVRHYNANVSVFTAKLAQWRSSIIEAEGGDSSRAITKLACCGKKKGRHESEREATVTLPTSYSARSHDNYFKEIFFAVEFSGRVASPKS